MHFYFAGFVFGTLFSTKPKGYLKFTSPALIIRKPYRNTCKFHLPVLYKRFFPASQRLLDKLPEIQCVFYLPIIKHRNRLPGLHVLRVWFFYPLTEEPDFGQH